MSSSLFIVGFLIILGLFIWSTFDTSNRCQGCDELADAPDYLCPGCRAYKDHTR